MMANPLNKASLVMMNDLFDVADILVDFYISSLGILSYSFLFCCIVICLGIKIILDLWMYFESLPSISISPKLFGRHWL